MMNNSGRFETVSEVANKVTGNGDCRATKGHLSQEMRIAIYYSLYLGMIFGTNCVFLLSGILDYGKDEDV
jgi:hypothetical protein